MAPRINMSLLTILHGSRGFWRCTPPAPLFGLNRKSGRIRCWGLRHEGSHPFWSMGRFLIAVSADGVYFPVQPAGHMSLDGSWSYGDAAPDHDDWDLALQPGEQDTQLESRFLMTEQ